MLRTMPEVAHTYFTAASLVTLGGASVSVVVVSKTIRALFSWNSPWPAFIVSVIVCFTAAYSFEGLRQPLDYLITALNTCLLFCTALGMNEVSVPRGKLKERSATNEQGKKLVKWWSSWLT